MISQYFVLLLTIGAVTAIQQVPVTIYYETLCSGSMAFITKQFTPTWKDLKAYINPLELVPFGKSESHPPTASFPNTTFTCNHGPNECVGNKFQSCLLSNTYNYRLDDQLAFIDCLMTDANKDTSYEQTTIACQKKFPLIDAKVLNICATTASGETILLENERKTRALLNGPLKSVPTIVFNNHFVETDSIEAAESFRAALCKRITDNPKPKACEGSGASITTVGLITFLTAGLLVQLI